MEKKGANKKELNKPTFDELYQKYYGPIFNYCFRRIGNYELARDICAESFFKAFLKYEQFQWRGIAANHWLYSIATNELKLYYRKQAYLPKLVETNYAADYHQIQQKAAILEEQEKAQEEWLKHQQFLKIQHILSDLPLKYQEVISLKYFEQFTIAEISQVLNKKEGTIKSLISRGLQKIRDHWKDR